MEKATTTGVLASISATITVLPSPPLSGWVTINESNYKEICLRRNHIIIILRTNSRPDGSRIKTLV